MKRRYLYALLFGIPGFVIAGIFSILAFAALTGFLWLFVFGDNPWPANIEPILAALFVLCTLTLWIAFTFLGFFIGRRLEKDPAVNRTHIFISAGLTLALILMIVFHQWSVGNLGPKSDSTACSDFCTLHGYTASGTPPQISGDRTCSCFDRTGNEVLRIPLDHLDPNFNK